MSDDNIRRIVLKLIKDTPSQKRPGSGQMLAVVQWAKDDKSISVQLVKSGYWLNDNDRQTYHKAKGLSLGDLIDCNPHWKEISALMKNPPAIKPAEQQPASASDSIEEVPF